MTDRPINLSDWQVRAALDGRLSLVVEPIKDAPEGLHMDRVGPTGWQWTGDYGSPRIPFDPKRATGDRLWVRETWRVGAWREVPWPRSDAAYSAEVAIDYISDNLARKEWLIGENPEKMMRLVDQSREDAKADGRFKMDAEFQYRWSPGQSPCRIRPSIHMPRWASRLTLIVTDVKVMRVQEVTLGNICECGMASSIYDFKPVQRGFEAFSYAWNDRHAKRGLGWDANPWVTTTTVTVHRENIDQMDGREWSEVPA